MPYIQMKDKKMKIMRLKTYTKYYKRNLHFNFKAIIRKSYEMQNKVLTTEKFSNR